MHVLSAATTDRKRLDVTLLMPRAKLNLDEFGLDRSRGALATVADPCLAPPM